MTIIVKAKPGDSSDKVIRAFQKRVAEEQIIPEFRDKQFHKSNTEKRLERVAEKQRKINRSKRYSNS